MLSTFLRNTVGIPSTVKIPINFTTFTVYVLPPVVGYFVVAVLAVMHHTRPIRVALSPIVALLAFRAASSVDVSLGRHEQKILDIGLAISMLVVGVRTLHWSIAKGPLVRHHRRLRNEPKSIVFDALDLTCNLRGHGWEWSHIRYIPKETRPANRIVFVVYAFLSAVMHTLLLGTLHRTILTLVPKGAPGESTIFDETLPFLVRYLRAAVITTLNMLTIYAPLQALYDLFAIPAILFLGQEMSQWPPLFDGPFLSTSVADFWGRRWHQLLRHIFLFTGGYPLSFLGRPGMVLGAFLSSGVLHHLVLTVLDGQSTLWRMVIAFAMMAIGIVAEQTFQWYTQRRVGGFIGWIWATTWLLLWGSVTVEGFARAGYFGCAGGVDSVLPVQIRVEHWVADFDAWLHTISGESM